MPEPSGFHLMHAVEFILRRKELLLSVFLASFVVTYLGVFFLVEEQFEASATLIPREEEIASAAASLLRGAKTLPFNLGGVSPRSDMDLYTTIIFSRTLLTDVIKRFDLLRAYNLDTAAVDHMELALKRLSKEVMTKETPESAFLITVRAGTRQRAADMTNYVVEKMNERIVELNSSRSRQNREFLERRLEEISGQLRAAEDSLRVYQERTGLLDVKNQLQGILTAHTELETQLAAKRFQQGVLERLYSKESPQVKDALIEIEVYERKLNELRSQGDPGSPLLPLKHLPQTAVEYLRRYREVELNSLLMEYLVPLYEQAKIEEKKDYPILQVIDWAVPPAKKSYPPRLLFALIGAVSTTIIVAVILRIRASAMSPGDDRWRPLLADLRNWKWKSKRPA